MHAKCDVNMHIKCTKQIKFDPIFLYFSGITNRYILISCPPVAFSIRALPHCHCFSVLHSGSHWPCLPEEGWRLPPTVALRPSTPPSVLVWEVPCPPPQSLPASVKLAAHIILKHDAKKLCCHCYCAYLYMTTWLHERLHGGVRMSRQSKKQPRAEMKLIG